MKTSQFYVQNRFFSASGGEIREKLISFQGGAYFFQKSKSENSQIGWGVFIRGGVLFFNTPVVIQG